MADEDADVVGGEDPEAAMTLSRMTVNQIAYEVGVLPGTLTHDQMLQWLMVATVLVQRAREIKQQVEETAIAWIKEHGPLTCGPVVYSVGQDKRVKCTDIVRCMTLLLEACGGDLETLCACLAANPYKYGTCEKVLKDQWRSVFDEEYQEKIVLKRTDTRFLPRPNRRRSGS